jgi:amino acid adenylation domain-containing protein
METLSIQLKDQLPLSSNQKRLWIMAQQDALNPAYNLQLSYYFRGEVNYDRLVESLEILFNRHHTMFSVFREEDGIPYVSIVPQEVMVELLDFSDSSAEINKARILDFAAEDSRKVFNIEQGPLYRLYLLKEGEASYYFHATIHHIIFDGWSRRIFVKELSDIYTNLTEGRRPDKGPAGFQSHDFVGQEDKLINPEEEKSLTEFWRENLTDCLPELRLPFDYPRKSYVSGLGRRESFEIPGNFVLKLRELGRVTGSSVFNIVVSLLGLLLHKYSGEDDICIGIPVSSRRNFKSSDDVFGLFVNTTVIRLRIDSGSSFLDHVRNSINISKLAIKNSKLPFDRIVEAVKPERIPGINPLFQVSLSWMNDMTIPMVFSGVRGERVTLPNGVAPFDITFYMWEEGDKIRGDIEYNIDIFRNETIIKIKESLIQLAGFVCEHPEEEIREITAITSTDLRKLEEFNKTELNIPDCLTQSFFEKQAEINPDKVAVISGEISLTYRELNEKSNQLSAYLHSKGVREGDTIGICLERSAGMITAIFGVLKAGCCYLPLDPSFPDERIQFMFEDSGARILITESAQRNRFGNISDSSVILMDLDWGQIAANTVSNRNLKIDNQSSAYIIYTSGSTGQPKGVRVHHQAIVNLIESMAVKPGIDAGDILLAVITLSFDMSVYEIFVTLSKGATLVVAGSQDVTDGPALIELIERHNINLIQGTPSFWSILLSAGWQGKRDMKALCGGEALTYSLIHQMLPRVKEFWNCYGPTETTVYSTCIQVKDENDPILIGKPIGNTAIHIIDKENHLLPVGVRGEVAIGGVGVTKGYHNRPDLTIKKFIRLKNGIIVYKTGDLGRLLTDGNVELFGRADNQIKLRGFRIEPGEVETLLVKLKGVREAVVKIHRFDESDDRLIAFLNAEPDFTMTDEEIKSLLSQHLPVYMIPSFIKTTDGFPRLPNGKINKKALVFSQDKSEKDHQVDLKSLTDTQNKLLSIWETILRIKMADTTVSFFDAGGNSLLGIRLINQINEAFGTSLIFRELVSNPSVCQMGDLIDSKKVKIDNAIELVHLSETKNLPLTKNQKRLWLISKLQPNEPLYVIRLTFRLIGSLDVEVFKNSLSSLFNRHHIVFSVIKETEGEPLFEIISSDVNLHYNDYSNLPQVDKDEKIGEIIREDTAIGFDLATGPLYRLFLIRTTADEYLFHMSIHHIIFDGWSQSVFVNDLSEIYNSLLKGKDISLLPLKFQQYDFAYWESKQSESSESVLFWRETLTGCSPLINFPYDYPRGEKSTGRGGLEMITIPVHLSSELKKISRDTGTSLFTTLLGVYGLLMCRYSGEDDINIGMPVAYRPHTQLERIFGMFVNTVVVRLRYENGVSFSDLIKKSDTAAMDAISHQDLPFESVVELIKPERISGANPLFQVAFAWQSDLNVPLSLDGVKSELIKGDQRTATFDITLAMWEDGDMIKGEIEYNLDLIKRDTMGRLREHFLILIANLVKDASKSAKKVSMISEKEMDLILDINKTFSIYPKEKTIMHLFEEQVSLNPDHIAIAFKGQSYTYDKLNRKANKLARVLKSKGVSANQPIGLYTDKSLEMLVALLAIVKAGGCYAPIDPEYPQQRTSYILKDAGIKVILVQNKYYDLDLNGVFKININSDEFYDSDDSNLQIINSSEDLAYILYTSGTTGVPKGTPIPHIGVARLTRNTNYHKITPDDNVLLSGAIVFDATGLEIWGTLLNGGSLYIIDKDTLLNPDALFDEVINNKMTTFITTSALFTQIAESRIEIFSELKSLIVGGDILSAPHVNKVRKINPGIRIINAYGPTENACTSTAYEISNDCEFNIPIGKPVSNSKAYIFDALMNLQPVGVDGELYVGGDGLTPGYLNRPDLNARCFIDDPYNPGERLYKTGDLVRLLPDGNIEFKGRVDNQLKIRGFRVELEEIESVLTEQADVIEAVVQPVKVDQGDYRLVAFLNVPETYNTETVELLTKIKAKLPAYMIPSAFKYMNGFPRTINGKIDRKALVFDEKELGKKETLDLNSLTTTENNLYKIWSEIIKAEIGSLTDSFFDIGGNSLMGLRLINNIKESFGVALTFKEIVSHSTISQMSSLIESHTGVMEKGIDLVHTTEMTGLPLTANQKRLWLISKIHPDIPSYIIQLAYRLRGSFNREVFERSINLLFQRHHIVFSVVKEAEGEPYFDINPVEVKVPFRDFTVFPEDERFNKVEDLLYKNSEKPFDLETGPLYRLFLIQTSSEEYYFVMNIHHIIFDGWSHGVLVNDLSEIYNSLIIGKEIVLEKLEFQQYDYAHWENNNRKSEASIAFWKENLLDCSTTLNFPYDYPRIEKNTGRGVLEAVRLSKSMSDELRRISKEEKISLFTILLSGFGILLNKYSGEDDLNIGLPVAYRPHAKLENILGMFVNTVVVRLKYEKGTTIKELIKESKDAALNAISHQDLPFEDVLEIVSPERVAGANPLFQVAFAWQNNLNAPIKLNGIHSQIVKRDERAATFDLTLEMWENGDVIEGEIEYNKDLIKPETIKRLKEHLIIVFENMIQNIDEPFNSLSLISPEDKRVIEELNDVVTIYPRDKTLGEIFEKHADNFPDKIAVSSKGESYTYKQLNERANQLARTLRRSGVKANTPVGLFADKSLEMIVAILAIIKAGGCYTPIDTEYPQQRIDFVIKDSGLTIILVQDKYKDIQVEGVVKLSLNSESAYDTNRNNLDILSTPEDNAYILYTSGTTGLPKGTPIPQRGVVRLVCNTNYFNLTPEDRGLFSGTIVFDASTMEIWSALLNGASLYLIDKETLINAEALGEELLKNEITFLVLTSALFTHLVESRTDIFRKVKCLVVGGDVMSAAHANKLRRSNPDLTLINGYGPTENSVMSTFFIVDRDFESNVPIGKPNSNSTAYIFDKNLNYQPIGIEGELYVGGDGLSSGYLNREDLNVRSFIFNPHNPEERIYKTGDLVRLLPDGNIEFRGRADNQLKIRGFRVELEEIEAVLSQMDDVIEAVVKPIKVDQGDYRLVAFLNVPDGYKTEIKEIIAETRTKLPSYMIPSAFKLMHGFQRTINGKIDRKALVFDNKDLEKGSGRDVNEMTPTERKLYAIWSDLLKTNDISFSDNFFEIGGNSLMGIRLINQIMKEFGVRLTLGDLIADSTFQQLTIVINNKDAEANNEIPLEHLNETGHLPMTSNQKRLWLISRLQPHIASYIVPITFKLIGTLDREIFEESIRILFRRHHIVFSVFKEEGEEPYCEIIQREVLIPYMDYTEVPEDERASKVKNLVDEDTRQPFDLSTGPLFRLYLIRTADNEHYFHMCYHHTIFDGWTHGVFVKDFTKIYNSLIKKEAIELEPLDYQQYDYAHWEANAEVNKESISFWEENLRACSPVLDFPYDYPRGDQDTGSGRFETIRISRELSQDLRWVSNKEKVSLFATMLGAFGILLHKYSGEDDLNIGLPVVYRPHSKLENIFGMFVNTIVVRLKYEDNDTFTDLIRKAGDAAMNSIAHQDISFETVVEIAKPERIPNTNPLFQIGFEWQTNLSIPMQLEGVTGELVKGDAGTANFDITLALWEKGDIIEGEIHYNIDLLKHKTIVRLKENYTFLLETLAARPDMPVSALSIISESERKQLAAFNETEVSISHCLVQELFESQVMTHANRTAIVCGDMSLTYEELDKRSNQIANHLVSLGVSGGDVIGICLERSVGMVTSVLGVLKAGCCYLPLDPSFPDERLNYMFEDSGAKVLLTESIQKDKYNINNILNTPIILIDTDEREIAGNSTEKPDIKKDPQSLTYIIYTSGSTGKPKGVKVHHQAVVNFLQSMSKRPGISSDDRLLGVTTLSFDISGLEVFLPLSYGAELVVAEKDDLTDGNKLAGLLDSHNITVLQATPATWNILLSSGWRGKKNLKALCGGEAIQRGLIRQLLPRVEALWNMYGPTETTIWSTCFQIKDDVSPILVGTPIDNTAIYILDKNRQILPIGVTGEVYIGGIGVTKGYHKRPELTAEKFIDIGDEGIIYRTGDKGRFIDDGNIELFGRIDNQIKLRGFRIEPGEIESLLTGLDGVKEAVVKVQKFDEQDERLIAFLDVVSGFGTTSEEIKDFLSQSLPPYMVPSYYLPSEGFPRLPNGKINRKLLVYEIPEIEQKQEKDLVVLTKTESMLMKLWCQILKVQSLKLTDNFFDMGGNSLLAIRLINRVGEEIGVTMIFKDFLSHPTIGQMGTFIDNQAEDHEKVVLQHLTETTHLPLTQNQKRLWLISQLQPDVPAYSIPLTYRFRGLLNMQVFERSLEILFERHHIVFSVIKQEGGEPYCDILQREVKINFTDYSVLAEEEKRDKVMAIFNEEVRQPYDLENGPLYRLYLVKTAEDEYYFHMSLHHIVFDGWSTGIFINDLSRIYNSLINNEKVDFEPLEYQQYDYAKWEAGAEIKQESIAFWKDYLNECSPVLNLPLDFPRKAQKTGKGSLEMIRLTRTLSKALKQMSKEEDSSLFNLFLSTFGAQMHKYSGEDDLNIGLPVAYRPHTGLEQVFGMFVNTVVVRLNYEENDTFRDLLRRTNEATLNAISHQDVPFNVVVDSVKPERVANTNPLFQVAFAWQNNLGSPLQLEGIKCERIKEEEMTPNFDLNIYLWENGDYIEGVVEYNMDILKKDTIIRLKDNYINLLQSVAENPDQPISEMLLLSEDDMKKLVEFNDTECPYEHTLCIHHKFEQQVSKNPDLPALIIKGSSLTYKELDGHANRMANYLIKRDIKVEDKVGICIDRSLEMMICIYGTLKAGAAYLPLSPENPTERLRSIIDDAKPKLILATKASAANIPEESEVVHIDNIMQEPLSEDVSNPEVEMNSRNLAYVLYTSGSTGTPKGVMIEHHSVLNRLGWMQKAYPVDGSDTFLQKTPITFDVSVWELFWWFFNGAKLVLLPKGGEKDPESIIEYIADFKVTTIHFVPSMFATFFDTLITKSLFSKLENMKRIFLSGEALPLTLVRNFNEKRETYSLPGLINLYGPTEATVDVSYFNCPGENIENVYIGKPIDNTKLYVVNKKNIIQPIGVPGELLITGVNLARGYLNRPELTSEKFFNFRISDEQTLRAYHTGDLVKLTPEGEIDYLGRMDNQIKIRGFRIELGDIEAKILEHPLVTNSAVIMVEKEQLKFLVAYVCLKPGSDLEADALRSYLSGKLPEYMVPPYIVFMETLPLTSSGKLNRKNLPAPEAALDRLTIVAPSNKNERILLELWKDLLKVENVSVNDNFFDIGGNSLLAINLANMISREFSVPSKALMIFEFPSIKAQSDYVSGNKTDDLSDRNTEIDEKITSKKNVRFKKLR